MTKTNSKHIPPEYINDYYKGVVCVIIFDFYVLYQEVIVNLVSVPSSYFRIAIQCIGPMLILTGLLNLRYKIEPFINLTGALLSLPQIDKLRSRENTVVVATGNHAIVRGWAYLVIGLSLILIAQII